MLPQGSPLLHTQLVTVECHVLSAVCQALAHDFAREQLMPHAAKWDEQKIFPVDVLKEAAKLGFAGAS